MTFERLSTLKRGKSPISMFEVEKSIVIRQRLSSDLTHFFPSVHRLRLPSESATSHEEASNQPYPPFFLNHPRTFSPYEGDWRANETFALVVCQSVSRKRQQRASDSLEEYETISKSSGGKAE